MPDADTPQHCPTPRELDDLELLVTGALAPISGFDEAGSPVTLDLPEPVAAAGRVELVDPEGLPLALATRTPGGAWAVEALTHAQFGPFRSLYLSPAATRERHAGRTVVPVTDALTTAQVQQIAGLGPVLLLALVGTGTPALSPVALLRATLRVAATLDDAAVVAVPLASHGDAEVDHALGVSVVGAYAGDDAVLGLVEPEGDDDEPAAEVADIVAADRPPADEQGLVLFFTGLSGSGKSTLAQALTDRLLERGGRTVTSLDGDVVRRNLSAGLTFSASDRETNIRRIGWVAAEISRHGGVAVVSPIAPFDRTRQQVRAMVDDAGGAFFLVHVATPLEECERRDRKGLYAKARRGEIPEFTGISSPYEEPDDADVVVDTTGRTIDDALADVTAALAAAGYLDLTQGAAAHERTPTPVVETEETAPTPVVEVRGAPATSLETPAAQETTPTRPLEVLFVCTANICRSPYLELAARHLAADAVAAGRVRFTSAGTRGFDGREMDPVMAEALRTNHDVPESDLAAFRSRPLTPDLLESADLVLTAEESHREFILADHARLFRKVLTLGQLVETLRATGETASGHDLVPALGTRRRPGVDVGDPYGRGADAAAATAAQIDDLLRQAMPSL